ncbi:hypothetical protein CJP16_12325 [Aeromonas sobria]|uniref:ATP-grasp domain-containing protein n=1 Tax=Aeromonas sobria TaxID=646 RepID=A0A2N3IXE2_AERSO|nr:ATP-grasp domain-containing protein [Aeromonas sobria]PKQ77417.1 hypothetical protein CJP16_12325 [Aeromonas sobria]
MSERKIIIVGSQDEVYEELPPKNIELYVIQLSSLIGPRLRAAAKEIYEIDTFEDEQVLTGARYFCDRHKIDGLFSFTEYGLLPAANAAKTLALPGISAEVTELCRHKWKLREKLAATPLNIPFMMCDNRSAITQFAGKNGFPLVLKDPSGVGSINVKICYSLAEALGFYDELLQQGYACVLAEKYVGGKEYSVETLSIRGSHQLIGVTDKYLLPGGLVEQKHVYPANLTVDKWTRIEQYTFRLLELIQHHHGPMHIEIKIEDDLISLIEINNRPGGDYIWDMVNKVSGVNLIAETLKYAFDGKPDLKERKERCRYGAMSYIALFKPISISTIEQSLNDMTVLERVQCKEYSESSELEIKSSFDRSGFILIGDNSISDLYGVISSIEAWIECQSHQQVGV